MYSAPLEPQATDKTLAQEFEPSEHGERVGEKRVGRLMAVGGLQGTSRRRKQRVGDCHDNAMCESVFATLACELLDQTKFRSQSEAKMAVFDFIEDWYNPRRWHSALDYMSPAEYEKRNRLAA